MNTTTLLELVLWVHLWRVFNLFVPSTAYVTMYCLFANMKQKSYHYMQQHAKLVT